MKTVQIESIMQFEATTTEANGKGFYFKLANNWTLTIGPDIWWITDDQKRLDSYKSTLSRTNFMLLYEKFKSNIKNKRRHIVRIKMSIVRTTEGKSTTMIDMFLNNSEDKRIYGMVGKDFIQKMEWRQQYPTVSSVQEKKQSRDMSKMQILETKPTGL